jgi:hypothetical protein
MQTAAAAARRCWMKSESKALRYPLAALLALAAGCGGVEAEEGKGAAAVDTRLQSTSSSVVTNDAGVVCRTQVTSTITTNGNLVTAHRRETRIQSDANGSVLETSTTEFSETYPADGDRAALKQPVDARQQPSEDNSGTFLSLKFGERFDTTNLIESAQSGALVAARFVPKTPLDGFDDYFVYLTPTSRKVVKVVACAKKAIEGDSDWKRHYLVEALERRYGVRARPCSWRRPYYALDLAGGRTVTVCLENASADYETVISAWDDRVAAEAAKEYRELVEQERKAESERRSRRMKAAEEAF